MNHVPQDHTGALTLHVWINHVTRVKESCLTREPVKPHAATGRQEVTQFRGALYEWVKSHIWMSHVTLSRRNQSCHTYEWVMSRRSFSTVEALPSYEWVISHIWMSTYELHRTWRGHLGSSESRHIHEWVMWHVQIAQDQKGALSFEELRSWLAAISTGSERAIQDDEVKWVMSMAAQVTHVLQCVAVRCSTLQCVAVCCPVLRCVAVCCSVLQCVAMCYCVLQCDTV